MLGPKMFPMLIPDDPIATEKIEMTISGVEVKTAKIINPAATSLNPVISINFSTALIVRLLAIAKIINEIIRIKTEKTND